MDAYEKKIASLRKSNEESKRLTRESIKMAILIMMKNTDFEKISVSSLIRKAGVSRAGFYRNYSSKEDVMEDICRELKEQITKNILKEEYGDSPEKFYFDLFTEIHRHPEEFRILTDANVPRKYIVMALPTLPEPKENLSTEEYYYFLALISSLRTIVYEWFRGGMKESAYDMAKIMTEIFHKDAQD